MSTTLKCVRYVDRHEGFTLEPNTHYEHTILPYQPTDQEQMAWLQISSKS